VRPFPASMRVAGTGADRDASPQERGRGGPPGSASTVEDGQPDTVCLPTRPENPVPAVCRDLQEIAGPQADALGWVEQLELGLPSKKGDPFVLVLIVPETRRGGMAARDNSLDPDRGTGLQNLHPLLREVSGNGRKERGSGHGT